MGVDLIYYAYIAVILLTVARLFLTPKNKGKNINTDDQPTTLASRGQFLAYVIGRRRIGPGFGWAGDNFRTARKISTGGGGKGFGGGGGGSQTIYYSPGCHYLCPGPASSLIGIYENGKLVYSTRLDRTTTPSGTIINGGDVGTFQIFWGELDQPRCEDMILKRNRESTWPGVCYIYWISKKLGSSTAWPQLEYDIECAFDCVGTLDTPYMLDDGNSRGVNPAHALAQILTGRFPYGVGMDPSLIDKTSLTALSEIMADEHLPMNLLLEGGDTSEKAIQGILQDAGVMMPDHKAKLIFVAMRKPEAGVTPPELPDDVIMAPDPEITVAMSEDDSTRVVWTFKDEKYNFRTNDLKSDDDGIQTEFGAYRSEEVEISTVTNSDIAAKVRARRDPEAFGNNGAVKISVMHGASLLIPGFPFTHPDIGPLRTTLVKRSVKTAEVEIEALIDGYSVDSPTIIDPSNTPDTAGGTGPLPDLFFDFFELPAEISGTASKIAVLRLRAHQGISGAQVWGSADGASYSVLADQDGFASGGPLTSTFPLSDEVTEDGPYFEALNDDVLLIRDLSGSEATWMAGFQIAVLNGEAMYLRNVTVQTETVRIPGDPYGLGDVVIPPSGQTTGLRYICIQAGSAEAGTLFGWPTDRGDTIEDGTVIWEAHGFEYQAHGLIRARLSTEMDTHAVDDVLYIFLRSDIQPISAAIVTPGMGLCIKTQPRVSNAAVALSSVTSVCHTIEGISTGYTYLSLEGNFAIMHNGDLIVVKE